MEDENVVYFDFRARERRDEPVEPLKPKLKGKVAITGFLRRRKNQEFVAETALPNADDVLLLALQLHAAKSVKPDERRIDQPGIDLIQDTFWEQFRLLPTEEQTMVRDKLGELTNKSAKKGA